MTLGEVFGEMKKKSERERDVIREKERRDGKIGGGRERAMTDTRSSKPIDLERNKICSREHGRNYERRRKIQRAITGGLSEPALIGSYGKEKKREGR